MCRYKYKYCTGASNCSNFHILNYHINKIMWMYLLEGHTEQPVQTVVVGCKRE
jgi:hypothetical protein